MARGAFMFSIPTLPKPAYQVFKTIRDQLELSSQQMVLLGIMVVKRSLDADEKSLDGLVSQLLHKDLFGEIKPLVKKEDSVYL